MSRELHVVAVSSEPQHETKISSTGGLNDWGSPVGLCTAGQPHSAPPDTPEPSMPSMADRFSTVPGREAANAVDAHRKGVSIKQEALKTEARAAGRAEIEVISLLSDSDEDEGQPWKTEAENTAPLQTSAVEDEENSAVNKPKNLALGSRIMRVFNKRGAGTWLTPEEVISDLKMDGYPITTRTTSNTHRILKYQPGDDGFPKYLRRTREGPAGCCIYDFALRSLSANAAGLKRHLEQNAEPVRQLRKRITPSHEKEKEEEPVRQLRKRIPSSHKKEKEEPADAVARAMRAFPPGTFLTAGRIATEMQRQGFQGANNYLIRALSKEREDLLVWRSIGRGKEYALLEDLPCNVCGRADCLPGEDMVLCDRCSGGWHLGCLKRSRGAAKVLLEDSWFCRDCSRQAEPRNATAGAVDGRAAKARGKESAPAAANDAKTYFVITRNDSKDGFKQLMIFQSLGPTLLAVGKQIHEKSVYRYWSPGCVKGPPLGVVTNMKAVISWMSKHFGVSTRVEPPSVMPKVSRKTNMGKLFDIPKPTESSGLPAAQQQQAPKDAASSKEKIKGDSAMKTRHFQAIKAKLGGQAKENEPEPEEKAAPPQSEHLLQPSPPATSSSGGEATAGQGAEGTAVPVAADQNQRKRNCLTVLKTLGLGQALYEQLVGRLEFAEALKILQNEGDHLDDEVRKLLESHIIGLST